MIDYEEYLDSIIPNKDSLALVKKEAEDYYKSHSIDDCYNMALRLYQSDNIQIQEVGVLLCGYIGKDRPNLLDFLRDTVSQHPSWKVQEILAMAFDNHCKMIGYEISLPLIHDWFSNDMANVRRAVSEGLRIWTSRPYFTDHPEVAIALLSAHRDDESEYVRKSVGNALRDISKKYPDLICKEVSNWDLMNKKVLQVHKLATKIINKNNIS